MARDATVPFQSTESVMVELMETACIPQLCVVWSFSCPLLHVAVSSTHCMMTTTCSECFPDVGLLQGFVLTSSHLWGHFRDCAYAVTEPINWTAPASVVVTLVVVSWMHRYLHLQCSFDVHDGGWSFKYAECLVNFAMYKSGWICSAVWWWCGSASLVFPRILSCCTTVTTSTEQLYNDELVMLTEEMVHPRVQIAMDAKGDDWYVLVLTSQSTTVKAFCNRQSVVCMGRQ